VPVLVLLWSDISLQNITYNVSITNINLTQALKYQAQKIPPRYMYIVYSIG
jgi:hypothetical protein